jgi:glyoxylase-like metal-dependent hydrolase (beta-lactamase superfamily II)
MSENERTRRNYARQDFQPLLEAGRLELLDGRADVAPGVWVEPTDGHSTGHQAVYVKSARQRAVLLGDVLPTVHHLPLPWLTGFDVRPLESLEVKRAVLAQAERDGWLLLFIHGSPGAMGGYLERRDGRLVLRPVEL